MTEIINIALTLATLSFGIIGWLAPGYTMRVVDLHAGTTTTGRSEIRAASGALFVGMAVFALLLNAPIGYAFVGAAYAGAAIGCLTAILFDGARTKVSLGFFAAELVFAAWLLGANLGAVLR